MVKGSSMQQLSDANVARLRQMVREVLQECIAEKAQELGITEKEVRAICAGRAAVSP